MTERNPDRVDLDVPEAVVASRRRLSIVWLIPLVAALVGAFVAWRTYSERGPAIAISFASADGLEAGKTKIKYKDVEIGLVEEVPSRPGPLPGRVPRPHGPRCRGVPDRGHALLGGQGARGRRPGVGARDAALGRLHRRRPGARGQAGARLPGPRGAPRRHRRPAGQAVRAPLLQGRSPRGGDARLLPQDPRRRGRGLRASTRRRTS